MAKGLFSYIRKADKEFILSFNNCAYCDVDRDLAIDHIIPPRRGGNSERHNLTRACRRCNGLKSDATIVEFVDRLLNHRDNHCKLLCRYTSRLRRLKKKGIVDTWIIEKVNKHRKEHTYFTKVLRSILNQDYILWQKTQPSYGIGMIGMEVL